MSTVFDRFEDDTAVPRGSAGKDGEMRLVFDVDGDGRSFVAEDYARVPFHVGRGMYSDPVHDDVVFVYVQDPTGAAVQGDERTAEVVARDGATAHVTTGSAQKVHTMETSYASDETTLRVGEDAYVEYVPDATILHDGARYASMTDVRVEEGGAAVVSEVVVAGRLAHGETFGFDAYRSRVTASDEDGLLFDDTTEVVNVDHERTALFDGNSVFGDLYVVAPDAETDALRDATAEALPADGVEGATAGATVLPNDAGVVTRFVAEDLRSARETKRTVWDAARRHLLNAPVPPRRR